jgi:BolA protein
MIMNKSAGAVKDRIRATLQSALNPTFLDVIDDSHRHADHFVHSGGAGHQGESHFTVKIVSDEFKGKSRVDRHRRINELLAKELAGGVHALAIHAKAPGE